MRTPWHFVVLPQEDGDLTASCRRLTHAHRGTELKFHSKAIQEARRSDRRKMT